MSENLPISRLCRVVPALALFSVSGVAQAGRPALAAVGTRAEVRAEITVKGRVVDEKGNGLPGVTVVVKGTTIGASTNSDGTFVLTFPGTQTNPVLSISYIGFASQDVVVGSRTEINVTLREDAQKLKEVVVIAYGEQSQKTLTSAVTQIDGEAIGRQTVATPGEALAALAPGVAVQSDQGGAPGAPPTIVIRGGTSLGTSSDPLFVVDGYPLQDAAQFNLINPTDIETISVLKDAASTAIYGSRAANGVVIVTTKRGKSGQTRFTLSSYTGLQRISKKLDVLHRDEYIDWQKDRARQQAYPGAALPLPPVFLNDPGSLPDTDWQNEIYRDAIIRNVQLSASGGTDKARYSVSGGYFRQDGVLLGSDYNRFNLRFNLDANLSSKLKIGVSFAPSLGIQDRQGANGAYNQTGGAANNGTRAVPNATSLALLQAPTLPLFIDNGDYGTPVNQVIGPNNTAFYTTNVFNPRQTIDLNQNTFTSYRVFANTFLEWSPLPGLRLKTAGGGTLTSDNQSAYIPATLASESARAANLSTPVLSSVFARESSNLSVDFLSENTATYNKQVGDHNFGLLGLFSLQKFRARNTATSAKSGTVTTTLLENPLSSPDRIGELGYDQNAFLSYGGRFTYDFRKKYLLSAALRTDASSRFGPNNRYAVFPSMSLGWRVSEEGFWQGLKPVMNELKFRASIGQTGNANIGSFNYLNSEGNSNYSFGNARVYGYSQRGLGNPDLTWEKNQQTDLGIDAGFLSDKITLTLDYYNRETTGMLLNQNLPGAFGFATSYRTNIGGLRNRGLELALGTTVNLGPVRWNVNGNISGNRSKVLDLGGVASLPAQASVFGWNNSYQLVVGEPLGNMNGFEVLGVYKNQADLDAYPQTGKGLGNWIIKDQNGDGKIDEADRVKVGKGVPDFIYGLNQTFTFKAFDLSLSLQGVQGRDLIMGNIRQFYTLAANGTNITRDFYKNTWSPDAPDVETRWPRIAAGGINPGTQLTNRQVYDGSFLRVRNLTLGYSLPAALLQRAKLQSLRLYLTGQNLFTFTRYPGYDPETSINGGSLVTPGLDQSSYPGIRVFTGGLTVGF